MAKEEGWERWKKRDLSKTRYRYIRYNCIDKSRAHDLLLINDIIIVRSITLYDPTIALLPQSEIEMVQA